MRPVAELSRVLGDVGLGQDADETAVVLDDRQPANLVLRHQAQRFVQALLRIDRDDVGRGDVADRRRSADPGPPRSRA